MGLILVSVEYPWGQKVCSICKGTGHGETACKMGQKVWVRKATPKVCVPHSVDDQQAADQSVDDSLSTLNSEDAPLVHSEQSKEAPPGKANHDDKHATIHPEDIPPVIPTILSEEA